MIEIEFKRHRKQEWGFSHVKFRLLLWLYALSKVVLLEESDLEARLDTFRAVYGGC